jgi:hypothetical protein
MMDVNVQSTLAMPHLDAFQIILHANLTMIARNCASIAREAQEELQRKNSPMEWTTLSSKLGQFQPKEMQFQAMWW